MQRALSILFFLSAFLANAQEILTLEQAIAEGLEKNFDIRITQNEYLISQNNNTAGNAGMLPVLDVEVGKTYRKNDFDGTFQGSDGTFSISRDGAKSDQFSSSAVLDWTIFDGALMFITREKLSELEKAGELQSRIMVENTVAAIAETYYQIVAEQAQYEVLEQTMLISEQRRTFAQSRYEVGKASKMEYLAAQVDYNADQSSLLRQRELLNNAKVDLNQLLGRAVDNNFKVENEIKMQEPLSFDSLQQRVRAFNPALLLAVNQESVAYLEYRELQAERYPQIGLNAGYNYNTSNNEAGQLRESSSDGITYGFAARWNIFNGFNARREVQNARLSQQNSQWQREAIGLELEAQLQKVYFNYQNNLNLVELEQQNVQVALENESIAIDRYELGAGTSLELREAQRNAVDARSRLLDAQLQAKKAEVELLRLTGSLVKG